MKIKVENYVFDKTAKTVTFSDFTYIRLDGLLLITNVTDNIIIYNFADPLKGGSVLDNVLTLMYDTSSMSNTDNLQIFYEDGKTSSDIINESVVRDIEGSGKQLVGITPIKLEFVVLTKTIVVTADKDNTGTIYIGKSDVTSTGLNALLYLDFGDVMSIEYDDSVNDLYIVASEEGQYFWKGALRGDLITPQSNIEKEAIKGLKISDNPEFAEVIIPALQDATSGGEISDYDWSWLGVADADKKKTSKVLRAVMSKVKDLSLHAPTNLAISVVGGVVSLSWQKSSLITEAYKVERSTDGIIYTVIGTTGVETFAYTDLTVDEFSHYHYRVRSFKELLYSNYSNIVECTTEAFAWYGIEINEANSSPDVTRIASNMSLHASLPLHNMIRGCLLNDDGTVNYYLKSNDWTKKDDGTASNLDGTDGQVMMEWPDFWYLCTSPSAGKWHIKISTNALAGFTKVPRHYLSAYQSALNRTTSKMASVKNITATYRGGDNNATVDAAYNTRLGMPVTSFTRTNGRTYARNRGKGWNLYGHNDHKWLYWFFVIEFATLNSQKAVNATLTTDGYKQGGLGDGVTNVNSTQWDTNYAYNPFVPCGASDGLANGTGEVDYTIAAWPPAPVTVKVPRYRGHENAFGHIWEIVDGVNVEAQAVASGNEHRLWVADNPSDWNDSNYANYQLRGSLARTDGYQSKALMGNAAEYLPIAVAGASNTYYCDYTYQNIPAAGVVLRMLLVGGAAYYGAIAGLAYSYSSYAPSSAYANIGSRLRFSAE